MKSTPKSKKKITLNDALLANHRNNTPANVIDAQRLGQLGEIPILRQNYSDHELNTNTTAEILNAAMLLLEIEDVKEIPKNKSKKQ